MGIIKDFIDGLKNGHEDSDTTDIKAAVEKIAEAQKNVRAGSDFNYKVPVNEAEAIKKASKGTRKNKADEGKVME